MAHCNVNSPKHHENGQFFVRHPLKILFFLIFIELSFNCNFDITFSMGVRGDETYFLTPPGIETESCWNSKTYLANFFCSPHVTIEK